MRAGRCPFVIAAWVSVAACVAPSGATRAAGSPDASLTAAASPPPAPPEHWLDVIGEYVGPTGPLLVLEDSGRLMVRDSAGRRVELREARGDFAVRDRQAALAVLPAFGQAVRFDRGPDGRVWWLSAGRRYDRVRSGPEPGETQLRITPLQPVAVLRAAALAANPPAETGSFRPPELVELVRLDSTIHLDIRYATTNNFLGERFYEEARAFLQRPVAEAVVRVHRGLRARGYGLLIHDGYRPWYVTKMFWDATPADRKWLVANPATGSRHNRGAAVDLTLYELATGAVADMPSTYDESTDRARADYPGGTSRQRWHRALLRSAMEAEGFAANPSEWWHFDHKDWRAYAIGNVTFDRIATR